MTAMLESISNELTKKSCNNYALLVISFSNVYHTHCRIQ
uniref:Uncharacterized protein n=1 Tax=Arundo donax TaxID=35708 RepID=A0A0A9BE16_ARUDO